MIRDSLKNALLITSGFSSSASIQPSQYNDRQHEYFEDETKAFVSQQAKYSSDFVEARIQGLNVTDKFEYTTVHVRFSELVKKSGAIGTQFDNYKLILIAEPQYRYIRMGAKLEAMGNTWLVINPTNMSGGGQAVIQRCDATWHYLDYYGNVMSEPVCINSIFARSNDGDPQRTAVISQGYFNVKMQYNEASRTLLSNNARLIFGSGAYKVTGYSDFIQEFGDDEDSVNMIEFSMRVDEVNKTIDDMENKVAGGKLFSWDIGITGPKMVRAGTQVQLTATSTRTSGETTETVVSTSEYPITYVWSSSNTAVATVSSTGLVTGVASGEAVITVSLKEREDAVQTYTVKVEGSTATPYVGIDGTAPESLSYLETVEITARYYENAVALPVSVSWDFSGADEDAYSYSISGNTATIKCWGGSTEPLTVKASYNGYYQSVEIDLRGI